MPILLDTYGVLSVYSDMKDKGNMKDSTFKHFNPMKLREKYSAKNRTNNYSSFWMDSDWDTRSTSIFDDDEVEVNTPGGGKSYEIIKVSYD